MEDKNEKAQEANTESTQNQQKEPATTEDAGQGNEERPAEDPLKDAKTLRDEIKAENKKTEKLQIEQRKMDAERIVGGKAGMSAEEPTKLTDAEAASRKRIKAVGLAGGAQWAKKMDKEDGAK